MRRMPPLLAFVALASALAGCATTPLISAAENGDDAQVQALLNGGADINEKDGRALFRAAGNGHASTVKLLLDRGAQTEFKVFGSVFNVLCAAVMSDSVPTVKVLLDYGLPANEPKCMAPYYWTPLQLARGYEKSAVAAYLSEHGGEGGGGSSSGAVAAAGAVSGGPGSAASGGAPRVSMFGGTAKPSNSGGASGTSGAAEGQADDEWVPEPPESGAPPPASRPQREAPAAASDVDEPGYEKSAQRPDDFALVIGISKYRDIPAAEFAERDARVVKRHLLALGYPEENIVTLIGDHATNSSLAEKLERWLPKNVNPRSTLFVYYSGHGAPDPDSKQAYLVPWDGQPADLADTAFPLARFYDDLRKLPAKKVLVALDACFSGAGGRSVIVKGARPLVNKVNAAVPDDGKLVVFAASQADQISLTLDDKGHGAFTYYFLKGLSGDAASSDGDGHVTVDSLYSYLAKRVSAAAHRQEREQDPQLLPVGDRNGGLRLR